MRTRTKLLFATLTATVLMSAAVSTASARRIELSNQRFLAIWTSLEFVLEGLPEVLCPVTLEGSFHSRTLSKVSGQLVGYVTRAFVRNPCTNGTATVLTTNLPWHIRYLSFRGTLPRIESITLQIIRFEIRLGVSIFSCLMTTGASEPLAVIANIEAGVARTMTVDETRLIECPVVGKKRLRGTAEVFLQGSLSTRITVRLVQ